MADIVPNAVISMPSQQFTLARSFKAAANGKIYIGKIDTDPVNPENQIQVYIEGENGGYLPVSQPIIINAGGYPVYNGQIAKFVTVEGHSMAVYSQGVQQFYFPNVLRYNPDQLRADLNSTSPGLGIDLIAGGRKYFKVTDYPGGKPTSSVSRRSDGTLNIVKGVDNTSAFQQALIDAQAVNGIVLVPSPENGNAYLLTKTLYPVVNKNDLWRGASIVGDGKFASKLIYDGGDTPCIHVLGTSGWPSNISLEGISLYSANDFVGEGWKLQGLTGVNLKDFAAYRFGVNLSFSNGSRSGIFTEFNFVEDGWLENGATNIRFRKDGGDGSFHGISLNNIINNNVPGQTGLDVGSGCVIYNADWQQVTFFGNTGVQWILNNGTRNGFETLYFEGNGTVTNNGTWSTAGHWRVQSNTGIIKDNSKIPFFNSGYITPTKPADPNFSAAGFNSLEALNPLTNNQASRGIMRLRGNDAEAMLITGYGSGNFESQGLAIASQSANSTISQVTLRQLIHLNGITSFRPEYRFNYVGTPDQLVINSSGRHTGIMGRRATGAISASASAQTITIGGMLPENDQAYDITVVIATDGVTSKFTGVFCGMYDTTTNTPLKPVDTTRTAGSQISVAPASALKITAAGDITLTLTTTAKCNYTLTIIGKGSY